MSILLYGATGQIGRHIATHLRVTAIGRDIADLRDPTRAAQLILRDGVTAVINATGIQDAVQAERHAGMSFLLNARAPRALALAAAQRGIPIVHFSGPAVFDGSGDAAYATDDVLAPRGVLGRSKAAGEVSIRESGAPHAIIRSTWVFSAAGGGFADRLIMAAQKQTRLSIVEDDVAAPTPAADLAAFAVHVAERMARQPVVSGTYHYAGAGDISRADLARHILTLAGAECEIEGQPGAALPLQDARLGNGRLDCATTRAVFGVARPDWRSALQGVVTKIKARGPLVELSQLGS